MRPDPGWLWTDTRIGSILYRAADASILRSLEFPANPFAW
jgi:hypothetical protein